VTASGQARRHALLQGAAAAAPSLAFGWVAHLGSPRIPFAPTALADRLIRLTPGDVATAAIDRLHHLAQHLLVALSVALLVCVGAAIAAVIRSPARAGAPWALVIVIAGLAVPIQPSLPSTLAAAALGGLTYGVALYVLRRPRFGPVADPARRRALVLLAAGTAGILVAAHPLARAVAWLTGHPRRLSAGPLPRATPARRPAFPAVAGLSREVTSVADHYVVDIDINDPAVDGPSWRLHIGGLVDHPLSLGFEELQRQFTLVEEIAVLTCISNEVGGSLVGCSRWEGVRLAELLHRARPKPAATTLVVRCADGYAAGVPLAAATHSSALAAIAQDGQALAREHGFPCRLRLPALYGMLNPKWVTSIELADHRYDGYWAQQGWSPTAVVRTQSRIDTPRRAHAGRPTWIGGVAWAGIRGIRRVEISTDGGATWQAARLRAPLSPWAWTQWAHRWTPAARGRHRIVCRATDGSGALQDATYRPPHPSGASGYHRVDVDVT
jgi:DMSO/TMAO reductase YedYZ molybdopterin-dependent catalytic subunit